MKRYITFFSALNEQPNKVDIILDESDFESIDSAFSAINSYKRDDFVIYETKWSLSDFVLDTQERILYFMPENGIPEPCVVSPDYLEKLLADNQN